MSAQRDQPNRLAELTEALVWLAGIEGENLKQSKDEAIRSKAAEIFRLGESTGWDKAVSNLER